MTNEITIQAGERTQSIDAIPDHRDSLMAEKSALEIALQECLAFIEMKMAHNGAMSVEQIMRALEGVQMVSEVSIAHHLGCSKTTRRVNLSAARAALSKARGEAE